jgi:hypothetical protein
VCLISLVQCLTVYSDISYTPVPESFTLTKGFKKDQYYLSLWSLVSLSYSKTRDWVLSTQSSRTLPLASGTDEKVMPDDKMLCFDLLYYIGLANEEEVSKLVRGVLSFNPQFRSGGKITLRIGGQLASTCTGRPSYSNSQKDTCVVTST